MTLETVPHRPALTHEDILDALDAMGDEGYGILSGFAYNHFNTLSLLTYQDVRAHLDVLDRPIWFTTEEEKVLRPVLQSKVVFTVALWYVIQEEQRRFAAAARYVANHQQTKAVHDAPTTSRQPSRRGFLKGTAAVGALTVAALLAPNRQQVEAAFDWALYKARADMLEVELSERFGMAVRAPREVLRHPIYARTQDVSYSTGVRETELTPLEHHRARLETLQIVSRELHRYPPSFFSRVHMRTLMLGKRFVQKSSTDVYGGTYAGDTIGVGASYEEKDEDQRKNAVIKAVHHEIGHALTYQAVPKEEWIHTVYGDTATYKAMQASPAEDGYVSWYSKKSIDEDMATTYAFIVEHPMYVLDMHARAQAHEVLQKKILFIVAHLEKHFPEMSTAFFRDMVEGQIGKRYWDRGGAGARRKDELDSVGRTGIPMPHPPITFLPPRANK